ELRERAARVREGDVGDGVLIGEPGILGDLWLALQVRNRALHVSLLLGQRAVGAVPTSKLREPNRLARELGLELPDVPLQSREIARVPMGGHVVDLATG